MATSFYRPRLSGGALATVQSSLESVTEAPHASAVPVKFEPIPFEPMGPPPYRLDLADVLGQEAVDQITASGRMSFHTAGDTGAIKKPDVLALVALGMERSFDDNPQPAAFFYHLGDVVYYLGERSKYFDQFYEPYQHYPAPIFAIPGNHDGATAEWNPRSLEGFQRNFCAPKGTFTTESMDTQRMAMWEPYAYWCLDTPLATFVGLYTNVPEGGEIDSDQRKWFRGRLADAPMDKALILALHHPVYSFDDFHSGSVAMAREVEEAINETRRVPNLILTAHVHNYQRIEKSIGTRILPFLVIGNGGYWHRHELIAAPGHQDPATGAKLVAGTDKNHGFATIGVTRERIEGFFTIAPTPESGPDPAGYKTLDTFNYDAAPIRLAPGEAVRLLA